MKSYLGSGPCPCGREHRATVDEILVGRGVIGRLPRLVEKYGCAHPFVIADINTFAAAGEAVCATLNGADIAYSSYVFPQQSLEPDEAAVGAAAMHFSPVCDIIIGVGSGVINDIGKILSNISGRPYIIVATAPSMDGYASATSSMTVDGLKVSLNSRTADAIIGDTDILCKAPLHMLKAGIGDMLAKYVSIAEWRIAHIITGEYYCDRVAALVREALKKCVDNADALLDRDEAAVRAVFEGLVIGGLAMAYAGVSRPASGVEHYFSHVWDMRGVALGTPVDLHGIQCAMGTYTAVRLYQALKAHTPDEERAREYVATFSFEDWKEELSTFLGKGAQAMIALEEKEQKYSKAAHPGRFKKIKDNWGAILQILEEELPDLATLGALMDVLGIPTALNALGIDSPLARTSFKATKDIRDKYVLSRLGWDLGILDRLCELL